MVAVVASAVLAGVIAGCADDDSAAAPTPAVESTPSPDTTPLETVTVVPYRPPEPATETEVELPGPTSTEAGVTPEEAARAGVRDAVGDAELAMYAALRNPQWTEREALAPIEAVTSSESQARQQLAAAVRANRAGGRVAIPDTDVPSSVAVDSEVQLIDPSTAMVLACVVDSETFITVQAGAAPMAEGQGMVASRVAERFVLEDGRWRLSRFDIIEQFPGGDSCPNE
jgi:hypothetical protein